MEVLHVVGDVLCGERDRGWYDWREQWSVLRNRRSLRESESSRKENLQKKTSSDITTE